MRTAHTTIRAHHGDTLDLILHRAYGRTAALTEQALELNRRLADLGPELPHGTLVALPAPPLTAPTQRSIQLWD